MNVILVAQTGHSWAKGGKGEMFAQKPPTLEGVNMACVIRLLFGGVRTPSEISGAFSVLSTITLI